MSGPRGAVTRLLASTTENSTPRVFPRELANTPPHSGGLTLGQLLTMTAGYPGDSTALESQVPDVV